jgi:hypothetical protein
MHIQSTLSTSNIIQELFSSFTARWASNGSDAYSSHTWTSFNHNAVLDMEIEFFHERFADKDPKLLIDHIERMASGGTLFFPTTLSLVYDKLFEKAF